MTEKLHEFGSIQRIWNFGRQDMDANAFFNMKHETFHSGRDRVIWMSLNLVRSLKLRAVENADFKVCIFSDPPLIVL